MVTSHRRDVTRYAVSMAICVMSRYEASRYERVRDSTGVGGADLHLSLSVQPPVARGSSTTRVLPLGRILAGVSSVGSINCTSSRRISVRGLSSMTGVLCIYRTRGRVAMVRKLHGPRENCRARARSAAVPKDIPVNPN